MYLHYIGESISHTTTETLMGASWEPHIGDGFFNRHLTGDTDGEKSKVLRYTVLKKKASLV